MKGKRYRKKKRFKIEKIVLLIVLLICISIMIISGIKILKWLDENKKNSEIYEEIQNSISIDDKIEDNNKYNIDFNSLIKKNKDTVAWIKVNGTDIEYPVVKTTDNEYYLTHSFDKSYNSAGWVFMDYKNKLDGNDKNIVIYAHNRRDGSLFGTLKNILEKNWQDSTENYIIPFITEKEKVEYQVFSVYTTEEEDYYITTNFKTENEFEEFIDKIEARSKKDFGVNVKKEDKILTLSTCADNNKYRVVLHAKKIK